MLRERPGALSRNRDFRRLWTGQSMSVVGAQVTAVALPLTAVLHLDAGPLEMGLLGAATAAPYLGPSLLAGVWVDRLPRRLVLVTADLARALLLGLVPVLFLLGALGTGRLLAVALLVGVCGMLAELAYPSYLPALVPRAHLLAGHSRLALSRSAADVAGPGVAGLLAGWVTAPVSLALVAVAHLGSAGTIARARREPRPPRGARAGIRTELAAGLRATLQDRVLRPAALGAAAFNLCWSAVQALLALHVVRELGLTSTQYGLCFAAGAVGAVLGALATVPLSHRLGPGRTILCSAVLSCSAPLLLPVAHSRDGAAVLLSTVLFLQGLGLSGWDVQVRNVQQARVPGELMGRMNGTYLTLSMGAGALGAVAGGALASVVGVRPSLLVGTCALSLAWLWLWSPPLRRLSFEDLARVGQAPASPRATSEAARAVITTAIAPSRTRHAEGRANTGRSSRAP